MLHATNPLGQWNAHPVGQSSSPLLPAVTFLFFDEIYNIISQNFPLEELNLAAKKNKHKKMYD